MAACVYDVVPGTGIKINTMDPKYTFELCGHCAKPEEIGWHWKG